MGRGSGVFPRLKRKTLLYCSAFLTILVLACLLALSVFVPEETQQKDRAESSSMPGVFPPSFPSLMLSAGRTNSQANHQAIYPYSLIPGGIESVEELKNAIAHDPLLKAHYGGFNLAKARLIRLTKDREVHVSYRLGNQIYWTKRKLKLFKGETLISDGENASRTRCGNRISVPPATPISPEEPTPDVLDTPRELAPISPLFLPDDPPKAPLLIILTSMSPPGGSIFIPPIVPIFTEGDAPLPIGPKPTAPTPVPEPDTFCLLIATLAAAWLIRKKRCH
jgi:hypothetical protein